MNGLICRWAIALWVLGAGLAALPVRGATVGISEVWSNGTCSGWTCQDLINDQVAGGYVTVPGAVQMTFPKQSMSLPPEEWLFKADSAASGGAFVGDYVTNGVLDISFGVFCPLGGRVRLLFGGGTSGRVWQYVVPVVATGQWVTVRVPMNPALLVNLNHANCPATLESDLHDVGWIGVAIQRAGSLSAQTYQMRNFSLNGQPQFGAMMAQFADPSNLGQGNCNRLPTGDLNGLGICNYAAWVIGAVDSNSLLRVRTRQADVAGMTVTWNSVTDRTYSVWRTMDLKAGFTQITPELPATPPENTYRDTTATGSGPYFYQTQVTPPPEVGQ